MAVSTLVLIVSGCGSGTDAKVDRPSAGNTGTTAPAFPLPAATSTALQAALDDVHAEFGFPGVIAGVWTAQGSWTGTSGTAGATEQRPPAEPDRARIGSITKTFTTTLILQLSDQGKVSLDDPIGGFVPGVPNESATLTQLANMTSGIPNYSDDRAFQTQLFADPTRSWTPDALVAVAKTMTPRFAPGAGWEYSNTNTVLLGMVIERVTGKSVDDVLEELILTPLGLSRTSFPGTSSELPQPHLSGVTEQGQPDGQVADATNWNPSWAYTAGAMISTLDDLHRWTEALGTGRGLLRPETQQMRLATIERHIPPNTATRGYGFGLVDDGGWIGHTGELPGYNTVAVYHPALQITIVVMVNSDIPVDHRSPAPAVFQKLAAIAANQPAPDALADMDDDQGHRSPSEPVPVPAQK